LTDGKWFEPYGMFSVFLGNQKAFFFCWLEAPLEAEGITEGWEVKRAILICSLKRRGGLEGESGFFRGKFGGLGSYLGEDTKGEVFSYRKISPTLQLHGTTCVLRAGIGVHFAKEGGGGEEQESAVKDSKKKASGSHGRRLWT